MNRKYLIVVRTEEDKHDMIATLHTLVPEEYVRRATTGKDQVRVVLRNESRPSAWDQLLAYIERHGSIANADLRKLLRTEDTLWVSKLLRQLVDAGFLVVANPSAAKQHRRYKPSEQDPLDPLFSKGLGKQTHGKT